MAAAKPIKLESGKLKQLTSTDNIPPENVGPEHYSSGCLTGGIMSIGVGGAGVATTFSLTSGTGILVDNSVYPFTVTPVTWTAQTNISLPNIGTQPITYIAIDSSGNIVQSGSDWTPSQMRQYIEIGLVIHSDYLVVNAVNQMNQVAYNPLNQLGDLIYGLGIFNVSGNLLSPNGANLSLNKSSGFIFNQGGNYSSLSNNPHIITSNSLVAGALRMVNRSGAASGSTTFVDVLNYDLAGVTTPIPSNKFVIHRIYLFTSNLLSIQRGQTYYVSLAEAKASVQSEVYITNPGLANGLLRGFLIVKEGTLSLSSVTDAFFLEAPKFGGINGIGGLSVSTLQNAYDNSSTPEILTDTIRGAVSIKRGSALDTDAVFEILNGVGATVGTITGAGVISMVSGSLTAPTNTAGSLVTNNATQTLTNKWVQKRTSTITSNATPTLNTDDFDRLYITAQAVALTSLITSGTPVKGDTLRLSITDDGTPRAITLGSNFEGALLPTTTIASTRLDLGFDWNDVTSKWKCLANSDQTSGGSGLTQAQVQLITYLTI